MHLILGTLGTTRGRGAHDVEPDDGVMVGCPEDGRTPEYMSEQEMLTKRVSSNKH